MWSLLRSVLKTWFLKKKIHLLGPKFIIQKPWEEWTKPRSLTMTNRWASKPRIMGTVCWRGWSTSGRSNSCLTSHSLWRGRNSRHTVWSWHHAVTTSGMSQLAWFFLHGWQRKIAPSIRYIFNIPGTLHCIE